MLVLLCLIWGVSWPVMKIALEEIPPFTMRMSLRVRRSDGRLGLPRQRPQPAHS
jgi:drug/metabolite transporter (DMT)-like permease